MSGDTSRVWIDLRPGEAVRLGDLGVVVQMIDKSGRAARLGFTAPKSLQIRKVGLVPHLTQHAKVRMHDEDGGAQECSEVEIHHLGGS